MVIEIKKTMTKADIQLALSKLPVGPKRLDARRFAGTIQWPNDPLAYQKQMRDEW